MRWGAAFEMGTACEAGSGPLKRPGLSIDPVALPAIRPPKRGQAAQVRR